MISRWLCWGALFVVVPAVSAAQGAAGINPVYRRAQTMVNDGNVAAGRALVDSMIAVATPGSNEYAEGIYWRAVLAPTAAAAEMDYRRVVVDHPLSSRVDDALIRLAQLEIARANYDGALRHLNRLAAEHPQSPARARAGYWTARALFDKNDIRGGCAATAEALTRTSEDDAELRNQLNYLNQRCAGVDLTAPGAAPGAAPGTGTVAQAVPPPARDSGSAVIGADSLKRSPLPSPEPVKAPVVAPPRTDDPATPGPAAGAGTVRGTSPSVSKGKGVSFSVQVAAYNVKSQADAMVARLKKNGYEARVDGKAAPFRVRIGRYETQAQASAVQRSLKAKQITGFVVQADTQ